ncbi:sugar ABC transporter ATP-binding protein [candidate division KSB3 bacterium]|uniref:Sugar ABC transporter ATP-binding protein n=1 Tax=candidate division KSB3 bacterium TaxID=2044937 RepID=A0A2G6E467_9BACT|nr:MAG: sugar ABC transporter ATP-binding protein [candidate division KSB3 bacterium]PIE29464.1 MAG: sugar ABC transporter ATP-binding protein [candidate division KSB3 bacterium]
MGTDKTTLLDIRGLTKIFPGVQALVNVDFSLKQGEIHALMGENGAGKSTLIKTLTGVHQRDSGTIIYDGKEIECRSPLQAQEIGISTVYQEVNMAPNLSIAENIFLGHEPIKRGCIAWKQMKNDAQKLLQRFNLPIDVERTLGDVPVAIQQMVAIARALELKARLLILDEPTSSLDLGETEELFLQMNRLKQEGYSIIFITHFLDQAFRISDRITVLRNGKYIGTYHTERLSKVDLISKLLGREMDALTEMKADRAQEERSQARENVATVLLEAKDLGRQEGIKPLNLRILKGEIVGCAGLLGSGRTELANLFFGIEPAERGSLQIEGTDVTIKNPRTALRLGIGMSPEDRKAQGIIEDLSVRENIILALQARKGWFSVLRRREQENIADRYINMLGIKTPTAEQLIKNLSGGNQQKVIIARWLAANPKFLILDEPTRGIDVGAKTDIQKLMIQLSHQGMALMFISSEIEELDRCSSNVVIMHDFEVVQTLQRDEIDEQTIMTAIAERHLDEK